MLLPHCLFVLLLVCSCAAKQLNSNGVSAVMHSNADSYAFLP